MSVQAQIAVNEILLLEQSESEAILIRQAADHHKISLVDKCPEILNFLRRCGKYESAPRPDLIILDLDLSRTEDCEVLTEIKKSPEFRRIPVVVIASSDRYDDVMQAYNLHANAYIVKPEDPEEMLKILRATLFFWLSLVRLPKP